MKIVNFVIAGVLCLMPASGELPHADEVSAIGDVFISGVVFRINKTDPGFRITIENKFPADVEFLYNGLLSTYSFRGKNDRGELIEPRKPTGATFLRCMITLKKGERHEENFTLSQIFEENDVPGVVSLTGVFMVKYEGLKMALPFELAVPREGSRE